MPNKELLNYLTSEDLYPATFEVYPLIESIHPKMGSVNGGTLITIHGTGFVENGLGGKIEVFVGHEKKGINFLSEVQSRLVMFE